MSKFAIACGGTGGHLAPGIAVAEGLLKAGHQCILLISNKNVDARLMEKYSHLHFMPVPGVGFSWKPKALFAFVKEHSRGILFWIKFLRREAPDAIIGFGGFTTIGAGLVGGLLGYPLILHEANRVPGKAIRYLKYFADRIYLPQSVVLKGVSPAIIRHEDYPVRSEIVHLMKTESRQCLGIESKGKLLVVMGGSQGASSLNAWVRDNAVTLGKEGVSVYCLTGLRKGELEVINTNPGQPDVKTYFVPFSDQMAEVLSAADLIIARAGAGSIAEMIRCRVPSILIPYPKSADNHQMENAKYAEKQGIAMVVTEDKRDTLLGETIELIFNDFLLNSFKENMKRIEDPDCLRNMVEDIEKIGKGTL